MSETTIDEHRPIEIGPATATAPMEVVIDPDHAIAFALSANDTNPAFLDEGVVPPIMTVSLIFDIYRDAGSLARMPGAIRNVRGGVHGEQDTVIHRPLMAGERITAVADSYCASNTPAGARTTVRIVVSGEDGLPAVEHYWTTLHIGGETPPVGPALMDHDFPDDARSRPIGTWTTHITRDQAFRYAGASNDHAPHHLDDLAAQGAGWPGKFLQGMCTFAMCGGGVVEVAGGGDPRRLGRLAARFSSPVFPGNDLEVQVYDIRTGADGIQHVAFEAISKGATVIKHGRAELRPA